MSFIYLACIASVLAQTFETNQTNLIKPHQYSQLLINPIRMFSREFDPGVMAFYFRVDPHSTPMDIVYFNSSNSSKYLCYMSSINYRIVPHDCFEGMKKSECSKCGTILAQAIKESIIGDSKKNDNEDTICINCNNTFDIDVGELKLYDIKTTSPVLLFDNTATNTSTVNLTITSRVTVTMYLYSVSYR